MKRNKILLALIMLFMVIGFASITTNLYTNGKINIGIHDDFNVGFTKIVIDGEEKNSLISEAGRKVTFETKEIPNVGDISTLNFTITNSSHQYDADVTISAGESNDAIDVTNSLESTRINAGTRKSGVITVTRKAGELEDNKETLIVTITVNRLSRIEAGSDPANEIYKDSVLNGADPELKNDLIPVTIDEDGTVKKADTTKKWYSYKDKEWANAIILKNKNQTVENESEISLSDIEAFFVWIPRFRYQIFNNGSYTNVTDMSSKTYDSEYVNNIESQKQTVFIEFESKGVKVSEGDHEAKWLTHPAFTSFNTNGFWVAKYELGNENSSNATVTISDSNKNEMVFKPSVTSWRNNTVGNYFNYLKNYNTDLNSHMIKNTEWGAIAYLAHSKYGINKKVNINNSSIYKTGVGALLTINETDCPNLNGDSASCNEEYTNISAIDATTTGNITGIYDMSGGAYEYVSAYVDGRGVTSSPTNWSSGLTNDDLTNNPTYFDVYASSTTSHSYNNRILGDATGELGPFYSYIDRDTTIRDHSSWYGEVGIMADSSYPWFIRGGLYNLFDSSGIFSFNSQSGLASSDTGTRITLAF